MKTDSRNTYYTLIFIGLFGVLLTLLLFGNFFKIEITRTQTEQLVHFNNDPLLDALMQKEPLATIESILISHRYDYDKLNKPPVFVEDSLSYLSLAVRTGNPDIVELLIKNGANPDGVNNGKRASPLFSALNKNDKDMVVLLLKFGASPTVLMDGTSAIEWSIYDDTSKDIKEVLGQHSPYAKYLMDHFHTNRFGYPFYEGVGVQLVSSDLKTPDSESHSGDKSETHHVEMNESGR